MIEMIQRRAARYVTNQYHNTSSVTSMLDHLEWETLESRRTKNQRIMFFKIVHDLVDIPADKYLTPASTRTRSRHSLKYRQNYDFQWPLQAQHLSSNSLSLESPSHSGCTLLHRGLLTSFLHKQNETAVDMWAFSGWGSRFGIFQTGALLGIILNNAGPARCK